MRLRLVLVACLALVAATAHAQADGGAVARKYAVLSLVGDALNVVTYFRHTAGGVDPLSRESLPLPGPALDNAALLAAEDALRKSDPRASVVLLAPSSRALYTEQQGLFDGTRLKLPGELGAALHGSGATHLVLLTKHRGEARLRTAIGNVGSGKLEGLGFYVDRQMRLRRGDTGESGQGFVAPFVYVRCSLVDVATLAVQREEIAMAAEAYSAARSTATANPWDALTPAQKVSIIRQMLVAEVGRAVPALVQRTP